MQSEHIVTFMTFAALTWSLGATLAMFRVGQRLTSRSICYALISLGVLAGVLWVDSKVSLGRNSVIYLLGSLWSADLHHLTAAAMGVCVGFGPAMWPWQSEWEKPVAGFLAKTRKVSVLASIVACFVFSGLMASQDQLRPYLVNRGLDGILQSPVGYQHDPAFVLEPYYECLSHPIRIAVGPDGRLHATRFKGVALQEGVVVRFAPDSRTGTVMETVIAENLNRPFGLAFHEGDLYVSRTGHYLRARHGTVTETNTGAVTLLRDTNGDGLMDYYHDVVTELPGAQGPDPLHQNNGITFGPDGFLYVTVGAHSDRTPPTGAYEGTILRSRPDGSELGVFARGFRNPFDVAFGPGADLFCTDNDSSSTGYGDELNHVVEDQHYGFPYDEGKDRHPQGTIEPLLVEKKGTLQGIAYTTSERLPEEYRDCLYVANYASGEIYRVRLTLENGRYRAERTLFARIPEALDIAIDPDGTIYVSCYGSKIIYRLTYKG